MTAHSEFDFVNRSVLEAEARMKRRGLSSLSSVERHALAIWNASGSIGNGSFQYFFECGLSADETASAYDALGLPRIADLFRTALSLFPDGRLPNDWSVALRCLVEREKLFDRLAMEVVRADTEMIPRLAAALRRKNAQP